MARLVSSVTGAGRGTVGDATVLVVSILAIASSALLVRWADAPAVTLALWRTAGAGATLAIVDRVTADRPHRVVSHQPPVTGAGPRLTIGQRFRVVVAGVALALHFASWLASLELTTVAASVTLVSTAPLMIGFYHLIRGRSPSVTTWTAIALAVVGVAVISTGHGAGDTGSGDEMWFGLAPNLVGDLLALIGAAAMAVYLVVGADLRQVLSTPAYTWRVYSTAAVALAFAAPVAGAPIMGFDGPTWAAIVAMIIGPQLIGHTGLNHLLRRLGSLSVALALLLEPVAATVLAWVVLGEIPPISTVVGAVLVVAAVAVHVVGGEPAETTAAGPG